MSSFSPTHWVIAAVIIAAVVYGVVEICIWVANIGKRFKGKE